MKNQIPVLREEKSLVEGLFWFHAEEMSADVTEHPLYIEAQKEIDRICAHLQSLLPAEQVETASQIIRNLNDAATGPLFVAEEKGFREGFQMALRLVKEMERWS